MRAEVSKQPDQDDFYVPSSVQHIDGMFDPDIYKKLPECISVLLETANNRQEKDILLLGSITVLSGCLPNVYGIYDNNIVYTNLFTFIDAPAGAGKGILNHLRSLGRAIHKERMVTSRRKIQVYEEKKAELKRDNQDLSELPEAPAQKLLFIPANNSASSFIQTLSQNDEMGILFSTEADTLANSLAQDWGNFSDILRCAFHHETVEMQRKTNKEYVVVDQPRLSVLLTGTNGQFKRLIPDTENGLFSRFMYYTMRSVPQFRNVFEQKNTVPGHIYNQLGQEILKVFKLLQKEETPVEWRLNKRMQEHFTRFFRHYTQLYYADTGERILATIHRSGLVAFRISMVLSTLRWYVDQGKEERPNGSVGVNDLEVALQISLHTIQHSLVHMANMPKNRDFSLKHKRMEQFIQRLPETFSRSDASKAGDGLNLSSATITRYLIQGPFERLGHGKYKKLFQTKKRTGEQLII